MRKTIGLSALLVLLLVPSLVLGDFDPAPYQPISQSELVKDPKAYAGRKVQVTDLYKFCGSDFCVQIHKTKINTRDYYCITLGLCLVRMYVKKDHPDAAIVAKLKKDEKVTVYGTFDFMGSDYKFIIVDHLEAKK